MLLELRMNNFGIIDRCELSFDDGLIAITGETGAGKSMVVDALSACLGGKVGPDVIRHGAESARIEASFGTEGLRQEILEILREQGLEEEDGVLILSREIHQNGRTVARVNGRTVTLTTLAALGARLVDVHGQSEHLSLLKHRRQLEMLDHFAGTEELRERFSGRAAELVEARSRLMELRSGKRAAEQKLDLLRFQVQDIEAANLRPGETEELAEERIRLVNAEKLSGLASTALTELRSDEGPTGATELLSSAARALSDLARIDHAADNVARVADDLQYRTEDLAQSVRTYRDSLELDPRRLDDVESRLEEIARLQRKYGDSIDGVLSFGREARAQLEAVEDYDERLLELEAAVARAEREAGELAGELSSARRDAAVIFSERVQERLSELGLGKSTFRIDFELTASEDGVEAMMAGASARYAFTSTGIDHVRFMVAFNPGEPLKPIEKVASGGETARFMLAVKAVLAATDDVQTLVFDEVDTGIGGRSAEVVAGTLDGLSGSHQIVCITHLPRIAAQASQHIRVFKREYAGQTTVTTQVLDRPARLQELAEMLAGSSPSQTALRNAEELLTAAG